MPLHIKLLDLPPCFNNDMKVLFKAEYSLSIPSCFKTPVLSHILQLTRG